MNWHGCTAALAVWVLMVGRCLGQVTITPEHSDGVFSVGEEPVAWRVTFAQTQPSRAYQLNVKQNGLTTILSTQMDNSQAERRIAVPATQPGAMLVEVRGDNRSRTLAGALISPERITPAATRPADFDAFWAGKIEAMHAIPANPQVTPGTSGREDVDYFKIQLDNINGTHVQGQLATPHAPGKHPALLILQWAGVYALQPQAVVNRARQGWLAMNIEPHDIPIDLPAAYYTQASNGALKGYYTQGNDDREKSYFLRMYLSCYRAADYLTSRDDWDGQTLVVMGTSMGGQQTVMLAGLHPRVSAMMACVPSSCDDNGPLQGRAAAFPDWASQARSKNNPAILETGRYFDPENFAPNIHCPALVAMGLIDETCPAAGVYAAVNQIPGPHEAVVMVNSDHQGRNNSQALYNRRAEQWLTLIKSGKTPSTQP